jgi:hypothetical protein
MQSNETIATLVSQYETDSKGQAILTRHGQAVASATAKLTAASGNWTEAIRNQANALLESKVFGDDEAKARKAIAVFVTACVKSAGEVSPALLSHALVNNPSGAFRTRAPREGGDKSTSPATPAELIAKYLSGHKAADIKKAMKALGYTVTKA